MSKALPTLGEVCVDYCTDDHPCMHPRVEVDGKLVASVGNMEPWAGVVDQWRANADLIGAAFTAAHRAREMGYDPIKAVEALPEALHALDAAIVPLEDACAEVHPHTKTGRYVREVLLDALCALARAAGNSEGPNGEMLARAAGKEPDNG